MNRYKILFSCVFTIMSVSSVVNAAPQVTFMGEVTAQTCVASINGASNAVVLLPTVPNSELDSIGKTTGTTPFTISVSNCAVDSKPVNISTKFLGHNVTSTGHLGNLATTNAATNVSIQLAQTSDGKSPITLNGLTSVPGLVLPAGATATSHQFAAQYFAESTVTAGVVTAVAEYTLSYF